MKWGKAAMVEQAIQQRNSQWAGEQTLFTRIVRPMMTWIEGFSYAITPLMAFAVMLGARGIQMTGQYLLMLLWIQLWMPILAVVNLYITMAATGKMAALNAAQFNLPLMDGLYQMDMAIQEWLAIGGMLASSTPAIALMLVYGGSVTATHFLGRMQGGDFINEKINSPDIVSPAPVMNLQPNYQHAPLTGATLFGAEKVLPSFQAGKDLSESVSSASASASMRQASSNFMESLSNTASRSNGISQEGFDAHSASNRISSSSSETDKFMRATGEDFAQRYRDTGMSGDDFAAVIGGSASLAGAFGKGKDSDKESIKNLKGNISGQLQNQFRVGSSQADEIAADISQRVLKDHGWQTDLAKSVASDAQTGTREVASMGLQSQDLSSLQRSATDTVSATETYNQTASAQSRFGASASYGAVETGRRLANDQNLMSRLDATLDQFGLRGDTQRLGAQWRASGLMTDKEQAYAAAGMSLLAGYSSPIYRQLDQHETRMAETAGYQLLGDAWNAPKPDGQSPGKNADLNGQANEFGEVRSKAGATEFHDPRNEAKGLEPQVANRIQTAERKVADGENAVKSANLLGHKQISNAADEGFGNIDADKAAFFRSEIKNAVSGGQSVAELEYDLVGGAIYDIAQKSVAMNHGVKAGFQNLTRAFEDARSKGSGIGESMFSAIKAFPVEGAKAVHEWVDQRTMEKAGQLTPLQQEVYRESLIWGLAGDAGGPFANFMAPTLVQAKERLKASDSEAGRDIAELLQRAAGQNRSDFIGLVRQYNNAMEGTEDFASNAHEYKRK